MLSADELAQNRRPVALAILVGIVVTAAAVAASMNDARSDRSDAFASASARAELAVQDRMDGIISVHEVVRDAVAASWPISRAEFRDIVASRQRSSPLVDVQAVSFNRVIPGEDRAAFERKVRRDTSLDPNGYPDFVVAPPESDFEDLVVVEYIEPLTGNESAFGFDIGSIPGRRAVIEEARDSGRVIATEPITLVQETEDQIGLLLISPVYDTTERLVSAPSRRRHFVGVVVTVVRTGDLFADALAGDPLVDLEIFDLGRTVDVDELSPDGDTLVYNERGDLFVQGDGSVSGEWISHDIDVASRRWRLFSRLAEPAPLAPAPALLAAFAGLLVTGAIAFALQTLGRARLRAEELVDERTADLRSLVASAPDATVVVDGDGLIVLASDQVEALLGHRPSDLIGRPVEDLVPADLRERHAEHQRQFRRNPETRSMGAGLELEALHADGSAVPVEISLSPLESGSFGSVVASLRDVSIQRQAMRDLETTNEMKSTFLATVSHELRTPLIAIGGFAKILLDRSGDLDADQVRFLERIADNTAHLDHLVEDLIAFSRLENERTELSPTTQSIKPLVEGAIGSLGSILDGHQIEVVGESSAATVDPLAFRRIMANLLTNAARYSPAASTIRVELADVDDRTIVVHVDDSGPGVSRSEREHIFERFWRGEAAREESATGTGIGLSVVWSLVEQSGGSVAVTDSPLGGARFTLRLPAA